MIRLWRGDRIVCPFIYLLSIHIYPKYIFPLCITNRHHNNNRHFSLEFVYIFFIV